MTRFACLVALTVAAAPAHPWACFHGDAQHTGTSAYAVGDSLWSPWSFAAGGDISGSPVVRDDGNILFGARDVKLYCLFSSGVQDWAADLSSYGTSIYFSAPALDDAGNAYITTNRKLVKVSRDGAVLWAWPSHNSLSISHSPVIGEDGKVYFACYSDTLYALNPDSTLAWTQTLAAAVNSAVAVSPDGRVCVATTRDSPNSCLWSWAYDGGSSWQMPLADEAEFASPAVSADTIIYVGAGRYLYAVEPGGAVRWRDSLSAQVQSCPAIANESTLYVVAGARLYSIDRDSGAVRWRLSIGGSNYCSPAVDAEGNVYVGSANGTSSMFYCIAPDSTILWTYPLPDNIWSSPAIGPDARVYVGCMNGTLYAFQGNRTGIADISTRTLPALRLSPNPASSSVRVLLTPGPLDPSTPRTLSVYSSSGRLVFSSAFTLLSSRLALPSLPSGIYVVSFAGQSTKLVIR